MLVIVPVTVTVADRVRVERLRPVRSHRSAPSPKRAHVATGPDGESDWARLSHARSIGCYAQRVPREVSVRDLRNHTGEVVAAVRAGERVSLTVNRLPVADIVPHVASLSPWVPAHSLLTILGEAGADPGLLADLCAVRDDLVDDR
jgi:prevent-host-death family protein